MIKVTSFNANGIRAAQRKGFFEWFTQQNIDFLCIQETKAQYEQIAGNMDFFPIGYHYDFVDAVKKGYSGVAIYAKQKPIRVIKKLGIDWADNEGRYIQFDYDNFSIASLYLPSGSSGEERQTYKMDFLEKFTPILKDLHAQGKSMIICGDFNIVHKEIDIKNWKSNYGKTSGVLPEEQAWLDHIFDDIGWVDTFRVINHEKDQYTWWSNRGQARAKNVGWRIDYQIATTDLKDKVVPKTDYIHTAEWYSDHAPLTMAYDFTVR